MCVAIATLNNHIHSMKHSSTLYLLNFLKPRGLIFCRYSSKAARGRPYSYKLSTGPEQCRVFGDLTDCVFPLLFNLGPYLSFDPILMAKVIRVGRTFLKEV
jgi:hypothetical protein